MRRRTARGLGLVGVVVVAVLSPLVGYAAVPAGTIALDFESADRVVAFGGNDCASFPGFTTTSQNPIAGSFSGRTGTLTPTAIREYSSPFLQVVPGETTLSFVTQRVGGGSSSVQGLWTPAGGSPQVIGTQPFGTAVTAVTFTVPAGVPDRGTLTLAWTAPTNVNARALFDTLRITPVRQATSAASPAGTVGSPGCALEAAAEPRADGTDPATVVAGQEATTRFTLVNPNIKPLTLQADVPIVVDAGLTVRPDPTGTCGPVLTGSGPVIPAGTVVPPGGCDVVVPVAGDRVGTFSAAIEPGAVVTEAGTSSIRASNQVEVVAPAPPTAQAQAVSLPAGTTATVDLLAGATAVSPAIIDPASVDLDPGTPGRQTTLTQGDTTITVDDAGIATVTSTGTAAEQVVVSFTVRDSFGSTSEPVSLDVTLTATDPTPTPTASPTPTSTPTASPTPTPAASPSPTPVTPLQGQTPDGSTLPATGAPLVPLAAIAAALVLAGLILRRAARRSP